jgi:hypothetical protein
MLYLLNVYTGYRLVYRDSLHIQENALEEKRIFICKFRPQRKHKASLKTLNGQNIEVLNVKAGSTLVSPEL